MLSKNICSLAAVCAFLLGVTVGGAAPEPGILATAYLFTSFRGNGDGLRMRL